MSDENQPTQEPAIMAPAISDVSLVMVRARRAPLANMDEAETVRAAFNRVDAYFRALYAPKSVRQLPEKAGGTD